MVKEDSAHLITEVVIGYPPIIQEEFFRCVHFVSKLDYLGKLYKSWYLASRLEVIAFKNQWCIVISSTSSGENTYRKI